MSDHIKSQLSDYILIAATVLTITLSVFCWNRVLSKDVQESVKLESVSTVTSSAKQTGKKALFISGVFVGITKYFYSKKND